MKPNADLLAAMFVIVMLLSSPFAAADDLVDAIRRLDPIILTPPKDEPDHYRKLLPARIGAQLKESNAKSTSEWRSIKNIEQWQAFRAAKLELMRKALGHFPEAPKDLKAQTTRVHEGEGFSVECLVFESRPQFLVTANLYVPSPLPTSAPGIIIHPSHHNPKTEGELQDMGMTWARAGCYVLVMDQIGHGERRTHPFITEKDYPKPFRASRQDYWFRYNTGMQLHLVGDSLIGWQAHDLMRGVDLLLTRKNIDKSRIIMMGSVAGGGDPVAVAAALDERIAGAVIFNFGGPQPETRYPLPDDAEESFNYAGSGGWESTRNMSFSARDGFLPWVIIGSIAPRKLIYAHEFAWDKERDPVWKRLQQIYAWHGKPESLASAHGFGSVRESGDKASHCNNIGPVHRKHIHPALKKWFDIPEPKEEYRKRIPSADLLAATTLSPQRETRSLHEVASHVVRSEASERRPAPLDDRLAPLQRRWNSILGDVLPPPVKLDGRERPAQLLDDGNIHVHRAVLTVDALPVPVLLLVPMNVTPATTPVTIMIAHHGKAVILKERSAEIAAMLRAGIAVCLPEVRGTGESRLDDDRGRTNWDTGVSSSALMLGQPMLGQRLRDLRGVIAWLRTRGDVNSRHLGLWGDSYAMVNERQTYAPSPMGIAIEPAICEPLGGLLAMLGALYEPDVTAIFVHRGVHSFSGILSHWAVHIPHDAIVPGMLATGITGASSEPGLTMTTVAILDGRVLRMSGMLEANNIPVDFKPFERKAQMIIKELASDNGLPADIAVDESLPKPEEIAGWFRTRLAK